MIRPLYVRRSPLTPTERRFYFQLVEAAEGRCLVWPKVRLGDLADSPSAFWTFANQHIDFVLADPETLEPFRAIELDDITHRRRDATERDEIKRQVCNGIGLELMSVAYVHCDRQEIAKIVERTDARPKS